MVRASRGAGDVLRPNSSLASVLGSSGLATGGNGCGLSVPLSCALAAPGQDASAGQRAAQRANPPQNGAFGAATSDLTLASFALVRPSAPRNAAPVKGR